MRAGSGQLARLPEQRGELRSQVCEVGAEQDRLLVLRDRFAREAGVHVRLRQVRVHVRDLAPRERVESGRVAARSLLDLRVDLARLRELAAVVVGDGEVQCGLGVVRVQRQRTFEVALGVDVAGAAVRDDPEHVVNVGELVVVLEDLLEEALCQLELLLGVVFAPLQEHLPHVFVHGNREYHRGPSKSTSRAPAVAVEPMQR